MLGRLRIVNVKPLMHQKAVALPDDQSAKTVQVSLICDALDFLATDYWDQRYSPISKDEMNARRTEKYGRPFEIRHAGNITVEFTPAQYRIFCIVSDHTKMLQRLDDRGLFIWRTLRNLRV